MHLIHFALLIQLHTHTLSLLHIHACYRAGTHCLSSHQLSFRRWWLPRRRRRWWRKRWRRRPRKATRYSPCCVGRVSRHQLAGVFRRAFVPGPCHMAHSHHRGVVVVVHFIPPRTSTGRIRIGHGLTWNRGVEPTTLAVDCLPSNWTWLPSWLAFISLDPSLCMGRRFGRCFFHIIGPQGFRSASRKCDFCRH